MSIPAPADLLRHRGPALVVDAIDGFDGATLRCRAGAARRPWPALLEGAAQAAGLAAGHFWRCRVEVRDAAGALLLEGTVTLAPEPAR